MNCPTTIRVIHYPLLLALGFVTLTITACTERSAEYTSGLAIENVNVIDVVGDEAKEGRTVVVEGTRIVEVAPASEVQFGDEVTRVDGSGRYLIPGLWDMHSHTWNAKSTRHVVFPLEIANGVVGIRNMAGGCHGDSQDCSDRARVEEIEALERDIASGRLLGPEIHNGSTFMDGRHSIKDESLTITSARQAREIVRDHERQGFNFLKVYDYLTPEVYHALADEARMLGIDFAGHVPWTVSVKEAAKAGQKSMEHGYGWFKAASGEEEELVRERREALESDEFTRQDRFDLLFSREDGQYVRMLARKEGGMEFQLSGSALEELAGVLRENGTWQAPTLTMNGRMLLADELLADDLMRYLPPEKRRAWSEVVTEAEEMEPRVRAFHRASLKALFGTVDVLHDAGVGFLAGTDCDVDLIAPGFHLHKELELFVQAGLTPAEALQTATVNAAKYLGRESEMGTVEEGKVADLVLLDANPLEDIRNTQRIQAVVLDGRFLDRERLDEVLEEVEEYAAAANGPSSAASSEARGPTVVVENGHVIVGDGTVLEQSSVVVVGKRIVEVTEDHVQAPDARRIDATGKTVLPGLIDTHVHLLGDPEDHPFNPEASAPDPEAAIHRSDAAISRFREQVLPGLLRRYLAAGFTTVFSTGDYWPMIAEVRDEIERGALDGPRLMISGPIFTAPGGHPAVTLCDGDAWCRDHLVREVDDPKFAEKAIVTLAENGVDAIKVVYDDYDDNLAQLAPDVLEAITASANEMGIPVVAHLFNHEDVGQALKRGVDAFVHMPALISAENEKKKAAFDAVISDRTPISTTLGVGDLVADAFERSGRGGVKLMRERVKTRRATLRVLLAEGAQDLIAFGTDTQGLQPVDSRDWEIRYLHEAGMSNEQILASLTRNAAAFLGRADDLGTLEPGKLADLIVVDGNPLEDISALRDVELVVKGGEILVKANDEP